MIRWLVSLVLACGQTALHPPAPAALPSPDPPEPQQPAAECLFTRKVHCVDDPSASCPLTRARFDDDYMKLDREARYSAAETRAARGNDARACCYVEFVTGACR